MVAVTNCGIGYACTYKASNGIHRPVGGIAAAIRNKELMNFVGDAIGAANHNCNYQRALKWHMEA